VKGMSSPRTAPQQCSRLSPHLAYGTVSLREVVQAARAANIAPPRSQHAAINRYFG